MYTRRCFIAVFLVLVWYFSAFGQLWTQAFFCFLCFFNIPFKNQERETSSTQTDDLTEDTTRQTKKESSDEPDATGTGQVLPKAKQYTNVHRSLLQVFKCAYAHLIQPWYSAPELGDSQPLYRALTTEFNLVAERIICKAKNFDLSATSVGCVRILTQHIHNAKQSDSSPVFSSRSKEMAVLRTFSEALVRNLFPEYLWQPKLYQCFLTEIVATKALDVLVTNLCNPDNLNQMVVLQLDRVTPKSSIGELLNSDREDTPSSTASEGAEVLTGETEHSRSEETREKKKGNRIKEKISNFFKVKPKQPKKKKPKKERELFCQKGALSARRSAVIEDDGGSSREGSFRCHTDTDNDSDTDVYLTSLQVQEDRMEFKLSYEMWRVGKWKVQVTNVQKENDELCFTVHLEERNNPENLHWDVRKTQSDILHFHSLWQMTKEIMNKDTSALPSISTIVEESNRELDDAYAEEVRSALEHFLQELVSDAQLSHSQPVFQFLCPLARLLSEEEQDGGLWFLLSGLANFLTPGQDEEESHNLKRDDKRDEAGATMNDATKNAAQPACIDTTEELEGGIMEEPMAANFRFCTPHESDQHIEDSNQISDEPEVVSDGQESLAESLDIFVNKLLTPTVHSSDVTNSTSMRNEGLHADTIDGFRRKMEKLPHKKSNGCPKLRGKEKTGDPASQPQVQKKEHNQTSWEQLEATKAIFDLLKEITDSVIINIFVDAILKPFMPLVKKKVNSFLNKMNPTEAQIASYIDNFRDRIWPDGNVPVQPPRDSEEMLETKERALQLLNSKYSNSLILKKGEVETVFKIFQDTDENKKLLYMLLRYVLREFLPGEPAFSTITSVTVKDCVS